MFFITFAVWCKFANGRNFSEIFYENKNLREIGCEISWNGCCNVEPSGTLMRIAFSWFNGGPYVLNGAWILPKLVDTIVGLLVNSALTLKMIVARTRNSFCFAKNHSMSANFNKHKMTNFKSIYQILSLLTILPLYKSHTQCEILFVNRWLSEDNRGKSDISYQVVYVFYIVDKIENFEFDNGIETGFLSQKLDREFWFKNIDSDPTAQYVNTHVNTYACHLKCHNKCK